MGFFDALASLNPISAGFSFLTTLAYIFGFIIVLIIIVAFLGTRSGFRERYYGRMDTLTGLNPSPRFQDTDDSLIGAKLPFKGIPGTHYGMSPVVMKDECALDSVTDMYGMPDARYTTEMANTTKDAIGKSANGKELFSSGYEGSHGTCHLNPGSKYCAKGNVGSARFGIPSNPMNATMNMNRAPGY